MNNSFTLRALTLCLGLIAGASNVFSQDPIRLYRVPLLMGESGAQTPGQLELSSTALTFSDLVVGDSSTGAVILENSGTQPIALGAITYSGSASFLTDASACPSSLAAGAVCALGVTFAPLSRADHSGNVSISYDADKTTNISLSGRGLQGLIQASSGSVAFGSILIPVQTAPLRSVTLTNIGDGPATAITLDLPLPFVLSGACPTLAAGQACDLNIGFEPALPGSFDEALRVASSVGSLDLSVTGAAEAAQSQAILVSGSPADFGSVVQASAPVDRVVTIRNAGNAVMTISGVSGLPASVSLASNSCITVAPMASCSITLRLSTEDPAVFSSQSSVTQGADANASVLLSGSVIQATQVATITTGAPVSFGSVAQGGATVSRTVTVRNDGTGPLTISGVSGLPSAVTLSGNSCSNVAPASTCSLTLALGTTSAISFTNQALSTQGASTNASFQASGSVTAVFAANQFSSARRQRSAYVCPEEGYCMSDLVSNIYAIRNNTGQSLTVQAARLCGANNAGYSASNFRYLYHPSAAQGTGSTVSTLSVCSDTPVSITWPSGSYIHLVHEADYNLYGGTNWTRPHRFGVPSTETALPAGGTYGTGSAQVVLSNGQRISLTAAGLSLN